MGALIGGLYATGYTAHELEQIVIRPDLQELFHLQINYQYLSFRRREDRAQRPSSVTFGIRHGLHGRNALLTDIGLNDFLITQFGHYKNIDLRFDQLPIPFRGLEAFPVPGSHSWCAVSCVWNRFSPLLRSHIAANTTIAGKNIVGGSIDADSYLRHNVADPLRFTLGGPMRLSASSTMNTGVLI